MGPEPHLRPAAARPAGGHALEHCREVVPRGVGQDGSSQGLHGLRRVLHHMRHQAAQGPVRREQVVEPLQLRPPPAQLPPAVWAWVGGAVRDAVRTVLLARPEGDADGSSLTLTVMHLCWAAAWRSIGSIGKVPGCAAYLGGADGSSE